MLQMAEGQASTSEWVATAAPARARTDGQTTSGGRYGEDKRISLTSAAVVVAAHVAVFFAAAYLYPQIRRDEVHRLRMVDVRLDPPAPPPAPPQPKQAETVKLEIVPQTPPPPIQLVSSVQAPPPVPIVVREVKVEAPAAPPAPLAPPAPPSAVQGGNLGTQMVSGRPPRYPIESRRKREQGTVTLSLTLDVDGHVASCTVSRSSGFARLDEAARDAVRGWRWSPTMRDGRPVLVRGVVEIPFVLQG